MMAEGSIGSVVAPEKNESGGRNIGKSSLEKSGSPNNGGNIYSHHRKASIGSCDGRVSMRRNFTEKLDSKSNSQESIPNYLRASTGSCHDFCKYGSKRAFEAKERPGIPKGIAKPLSSEQKSVQKTVPEERKKKVVVKHKASLGNKSHLPEHKPSLDAKSLSPKSKPSLDIQINSLKQKGSPDNKTHIQMHKPSSSKRIAAPCPSEIIKREIVPPSRKVEVPLKQDSLIDNKMPGSEKRKNVSNKHSPSSLSVRPLSSSDTSVGINGKGRRNSDIKTSRKILAPESSIKKNLAPLPVSLSPKISFSRTVSWKARKIISSKVTSPFKKRNRICKPETKRPSDAKIPDKNLHVIQTDGHLIQSHPSSSSLVSLSLAKSPSLLSLEEEKNETEFDESEADEMISDNNEAAEVSKVKLVKEKHIKVLRKSRVVGSEGKDGTPVKLKFRRGKVVDLKSENNSPRRLRFRKGRVLVEDQGNKSDLTRKIFKTDVLGDDKNGADPSSEKVVLKHQDVQGKKDAQGLFNNVIEETASKLVESRKSKVKALVGAFETVISLQECKPPSHDAT